MLLADEVLHAYAIISNSIMLLFTSLFKKYKNIRQDAKAKTEIRKNVKQSKVFENVLNRTGVIAATFNLLLILAFKFKDNFL